MKTVVRLLTLLTLCGLLLCACGEKTQTVSAGGVTLTMPGNYRDCSNEDDAAGYTVAYHSFDGAITVLKEPRSGFTAYGLDQMTTETYVQLMKEGYQLEGEPEQLNHLLTFTFERQGNTYLSGVWSDDEAFWQIQAGCPTANFPSQEQTFREILSSVQFS